MPTPGCLPCILWICAQVSGVEAGSAAEAAGITIGTELHSINDTPLQHEDKKQAAVTALLSTVCHRQVKLLASPPDTSHDNARCWYLLVLAGQTVLGRVWCPDMTVHICHPSLSKVSRSRYPFKEFDALPEVGAAVLTIEHCCHCAEHQDTTRHVESRYVSYAEQLKDAVESVLPSLQVAVRCSVPVHPRPCLCTRYGYVSVQSAQLQGGV